MKRIWSILLTMTVALTLLCPMTAYAATGEGNIDGGGGNLSGPMTMQWYLLLLI